MKNVSFAIARILCLAIAGFFFWKLLANDPNSLKGLAISIFYGLISVLFILTWMFLGLTKIKNHKNENH